MNGSSNRKEGTSGRAGSRCAGFGIIVSAASDNKGADGCTWNPCGWYLWAPKVCSCIRYLINGLAYAVTKLAVRGLAVQRDPGRHYVTSCLVKHQSAASLLLRKTCDTIACDNEIGVDLCGHQTVTVLE